MCFLLHDVETKEEFLLGEFLTQISTLDRPLSQMKRVAKTSWPPISFLPLVFSHWMIAHLRASGGLNEDPGTKAVGTGNHRIKSVRPVADLSVEKKREKKVSGFWFVSPEGIWSH